MTVIRKTPGRALLTRYFPLIPQPVPGHPESAIAAADAIKRWIETLGGAVGPAGSPYHAVTWSNISPSLVKKGGPGLPPTVSLPANLTGLTDPQVLARISLQTVQG